MTIAQIYTVILFVYISVLFEGVFALCISLSKERIFKQNILVCSASNKYEINSIISSAFNSRKKFRRKVTPNSINNFYI